MNIAIFASGGGSIFLNITKACHSGEINAQVKLLVTDNKNAGALKHAKDLAVPRLVLPPKDFENFEAWDSQLTSCLKKEKIDFIILAGFLKKIGPQLISNFENKIINTHPSLLPKFGGPGMYGSRVHQAVITAKEKQTGITVHRVTQNYDEGGAIAQKIISILPSETANELEARLKKIEHGFIIEVVKSICSGDIDI